MDHGGEALIGLVAAHGDAFELLQLAEEVLDQVPPLVDIGVDLDRRQAVRTLRDDDLGASLVQLVDNPVRIERLVADQAFKLDVLDQRRDADRVIAVPWQQDKTDQVAEGVGEGQNFGGEAALGAPYSLALSPPFAP